jgi:hypothetical protein
MVIMVNVGKNMVEDVILDGGSQVNAIMDELRWKLGLLFHPNQFHSIECWDFS